MHIPMRDDFMSAHAHATAQCVLDIPAALRKKLIHTGDFALPILSKSEKKFIRIFIQKLRERNCALYITINAVHFIPF